MLNVNKFNTKIKEHGGLANSSKFIMRINAGGSSITNPNAIGGALPVDGISDLILFIDSVNLPGKTFVNSDIRRFGYGPIERRPVNQIFSELTCTMLVPNDGSTIESINKWMDYILPTHENMEQSFVGGFGDSNQGLLGSSFDVAYPDTYMTTIDLFVLDQRTSYDNKSYLEIVDDEASLLALKTAISLGLDQTSLEKYNVVHYKFYDAFPSAIGDVDLNWNNNNNVMRVPVTFQYKIWKHERAGMPNQPNKVLSGAETSRNGLPNISGDISIGPGGISGGINILGGGFNARVGTDGVSGSVQTGIGNISLDPAGRLSTRLNIPIQLGPVRVNLGG